VKPQSIKVVEVPAVLCIVVAVVFWTGIWTIAGWIWHLFASLVNFLLPFFA
jgi:hypothetical protein